METPPGDRRKPLLTMKGGYEVFGKKMIFRRDRKDRATDPGMLQIHRGEIVYLKAASGVGKTTLAKIIMGLQPCRQLEMRIGELEFSEDTPAGPGSSRSGPGRSAWCSSTPMKPST